MSNALIRPVRPETTMKLTGVPAYGTDLAVMLAKLMAAHGYIQEEPADLEGLLAAGDAAMATLGFESQANEATQIFQGYFGFEGTVLNVEFQAPVGATVAEKDAAFMAALAQKADIDYLAIGEISRQSS